MSTRKRTRSSVAAGASDTAAEIQNSPAPPSKSNSFRSEGISDYERARLENIQRNEMFLASLGLESVKSSLVQSAAARAPIRKKAVAVRKPVQSAPLRRSGRVTIEKLQEEIALLERSGDSEALAARKAELDAMMAKRQEGSYQVVIDATAEGEREWKRKDEGPLFFDAMTYDEGKYDRAKAVVDLKSMVQELHNFHVHDTKKEPRAVQAIDEYTASLQKLTINNGEVTKLAENRLTSVFVHPTTEKIVVFAGDKSGNLGVWDVSKMESSDIEGVYKYQPHASNIARIDVSPLNPTSVYSTSYDGTVQLFDTEKEAFTLAFMAPEEQYGFYYTDANFLHDQPKCLYVSTNDACAALVDFRASNRAYQWKRECEMGYRLNSVQQHPTQPHLIVTAERNAVVLYDVRKGAANSAAKLTSSLKALKILEGHTHSINAAYISPDGEYLVSVGQDHTLRTWRNFSLPHEDADCVVTRHDNNTGRWLSTFRPAFDPKHPHAFALGSMIKQRRVEIFSPVSLGKSFATPDGAKKGTKKAAAQESSKEPYDLKLLHNLENEWLASVCSRNAFHPTLNVLVGGNSSGRVHVFREKMEEV
eukprot:gene14180-16305_t